MTDRRHSTVFDVLEAIQVALSGAPLPPHPTTGKLPQVGQVTAAPERGYERIGLDLQVKDDARITWVTIGAGRRDEIYALDIFVMSRVPGKTDLDVLRRLAELTDVVQDVFFDPVDGSFAQWTDAPWFSKRGGVRRVTANVDATDEGIIGQAVLSVDVYTRI